MTQCGALSPPPPPPPPSSDGTCVAKYRSCHEGGSCCGGLTCYRKDEHYSQCLSSCPTDRTPNWECNQVVPSVVRSAGGALKQGAQDSDSLGTDEAHAVEESKDGDANTQEQQGGDPPSSHEQLSSGDEPPAKDGTTPKDVSTALVIGLTVGGGALVIAVLSIIACHCARRRKAAKPHVVTHPAMVTRASAIPSSADIEAACEERAPSFDKNISRHGSSL